MGYTDWMIRTKQIGTCSCDYDCPCEFNAPPTTGFAIYASTIAHEPDPVFADIVFEFDLEKRRGRFFVDNVLEADVEPIRNPVTGEDHHIAIRPHRGFEFREAEMASASFWSRGELDRRHAGRSAAMSFVTYGPHGVIPGESFPQRSA